MAVTARKYNPGFLTDDELVASFCVRTAEFEMMVEVLRECTGASNPHQIVIGPRGSGKTSLLLRIAAEARRDPELAAGFFPLVFAEESYEVSTAGELWLECLAQLAAQAPRHEDEPDLQSTLEELRAVRDDRELADRCLGALLDHSDREGKRLVLMVENLDMMFRDMADADAGWRLRKILQTEPRIVLLASATSRFDEIDNPKHALYDLFSVRTLRPLDTNECATLWEAVAGQCPPPRTIRSLEILTGGSPRLLTIVARFGAELSFRKLMASLLDLIDDHTEYFKSHLEALPAQERRVYLALASLWKPATTKEIADHARLDTSKCSAQLTRLVERGAVQTAGGSARRKQYYLTERLYNIYYLLRRSRRSDRLVEALIHFMESFYSPSELKDISTRIIRDAESFTSEIQSLSQAALARLVDLPALAKHREDLLAMIPQGFVGTANRDSALPDGAIAVSTNARSDRLWTGSDQGSTDKQLEAAKVLFDKATELDDQNRAKDALATYDELLRRFGEEDRPLILVLVGMTLINKGVILDSLNRPEEAMIAFDEVVRRFGKIDPAYLGLLGIALISKVAILGRLSRLEDVLTTCDEIVRRCGENDESITSGLVARALLAKGTALRGLNRLEEASAVYDEVVRRLGESSTSELLTWVALALISKLGILVVSNRAEEALNTCEEVVRRFGASSDVELCVAAERALLEKADIELELRRYEAAIETADRALGRQIPALRENRLKAHLIRARATLASGNRPAAEGDIRAALALPLENDSLTREVLHELMFLSTVLWPDRMLECIKASPSAGLLLPLSTALEMDLGLEPRVAREVKEVAEDIRRDLAKLREAGADESDGVNVVSLPTAVALGSKDA